MLTTNLLCLVYRQETVILQVKTVKHCQNKHPQFNAFVFVLQIGGENQLICEILSDLKEMEWKGVQQSQQKETNTNYSFSCMPQQKSMRSDIDRDEAISERWVSKWWLGGLWFVSSSNQ